MDVLFVAVVAVFILYMNEPNRW